MYPKNRFRSDATGASDGQVMQHASRVAIGLKLALTRKLYIPPLQRTAQNAPVTNAILALPIAQIAKGVAPLLPGPIAKPGP